MATILEQVREELSVARRNKAKGNVAFYSWLLSELSPKDKTQVYSDQAAASKVRKLVKVSEENYEKTQDNKFLLEITALEKLLPTPLTPQEVTAVLTEAVHELGDPNMGTLMKWMKTHFANRFDGRVVSPVVKQYIQGQ